MMVVLYHPGLTISRDKYFGIEEFAIPFSFGAAGVEFFFVLSRFIIFTAHRNDIFKPHKLAGYLRKRLVRIYPGYWIIFLSVFIMAIAFPATRNTVPHDVFVILKSFLLIPQDKNIVGGTGAPVIYVAWTLQYELLFYLLFAFLIFSRWLAIFAIGSLVIMYFYFKFVGSLSPSFPFSFLTEDYILLFFIGMGVSVASTSKKVIVNSPLSIASFGFGMFLIVAVDTMIGNNLFSDWKTILYGIASGLIVFGLVQAEDKGRIIGGQNWLQLLGNSSYALYLIHFPLISIMCKLAISIHFNNFGSIGALFSYVIIFGACLFSSVFFHLWIEKPVGRFFRNRRSKPASIDPQNTLEVAVTPVREAP